jgi:hypothetical protein
MVRMKSDIAGSPQGFPPAADSVGCEAGIFFSEGGRLEAGIFVSEGDVELYLFKVLGVIYIPNNLD